MIDEGRTPNIKGPEYEIAEAWRMLKAAERNYARVLDRYSKDLYKHGLVAESADAVASKATSSKE